MIHKIKIEFVNGDKPHEYRLGPGPCGYSVTTLEVRRPEDEVSVVQRIEEHPDAAVFTYPLRHVKRVAVYSYPGPEVCDVR